MVPAKVLRNLVIKNRNLCSGKWIHFVRFIASPLSVSEKSSLLKGTFAVLGTTAGQLLSIAITKIPRFNDQSVSR